MNLSERGAEFIRGYEQCRLRAYMPTVNDVWTIGWGHTGPEVHDGLEWTQEQADAAFDKDASMFVAGVNMAKGAASTTQAQFDAMVSLAYNIGLANFRKSSVLRKHIAGEHASAAEWFLAWNKQAGKVLRGLTRRRTAERAMYLGEAI